MRISIPQIIGALFFCLFSFWNLFMMVITLRNKYVMAFFLNFECKFEMAVFGSPIRIIRDESGVSQGHSKSILLISNHQSLADILVMFAIMPFPLSFVAKKELFRVPFLNFHLWATGCLSIDRHSPRKAYRDMEHAAKVLKKRSLLVFPEGTRQTEDAIGSFKRGFLKLALDSGVDLVPVVSRGTANIMKKNSLNVGKGNEVKVIIGRIWTTQELQSEDASRKLHEWFVSGYEELKNS